MKEYRLRAVQDAREAFPGIIISATGGIEDGDDAYETLKAGANTIECYTPLMFRGFGLEISKMKRISKRLKEDGFKNLRQLQEEKLWA